MVGDEGHISVVVGIGELFGDGLFSIEPPIRYTFRRSLSVFLRQGLLASCYGPDAVRSLFERDNSYNFGALAENTVCECLVKNGYRPRFYRKNNGQGRMEIDFVIENADGITAIEVKSGKTRDMPSLWKLPQYFKVDRRILLAEEDVSVDDDGIEHLPLFAAAFFEPNDEFDWPWRMDPDRLRHR